MAAGLLFVFRNVVVDFSQAVSADTGVVAREASPVHCTVQDTEWLRLRLLFISLPSLSLLRRKLRGRHWHCSCRLSQLLQTPRDAKLVNYSLHSPPSIIFDLP